MIHFFTQTFWRHEESVSSTGSGTEDGYGMPALSESLSYCETQGGRCSPFSSLGDFDDYPAHHSNLESHEGAEGISGENYDDRTVVDYQSFQHSGDR